MRDEIIKRGNRLNLNEKKGEKTNLQNRPNLKYINTLQKALISTYNTNSTIKILRVKFQMKFG